MKSTSCMEPLESRRLLSASGSAAHEAHLAHLAHLTHLRHVRHVQHVNHILALIAQGRLGPDAVTASFMTNHGLTGTPMFSATPTTSNSTGAGDLIAAPGAGATGMNSMTNGSLFNSTTAVPMTNLFTDQSS